MNVAHLVGVVLVVSRGILSSLAQQEISQSVRLEVGVAAKWSAPMALLACESAEAAAQGSSASGMHAGLLAHVPRTVGVRLTPPLLSYCTKHRTIVCPDLRSDHGTTSWTPPTLGWLVRYLSRPWVPRYRATSDCWRSWRKARRVSGQVGNV